jgi:hypothetical protein
VIRLSLSHLPASLDESLDDLRGAASARAAISALIRFVAAHWRCGVVLTVDGDVLRPTLAFGDVARFDSISSVAIPREATGSIAAAGREPAVMLQATDPLLPALLCDRPDAAAMALSIPQGLEVRHVVFACDPLPGGSVRAAYALLLHQLAQTLARIARPDRSAADRALTDSGVWSAREAIPRRAATGG